MKAKSILAGLLLFVAGCATVCLISSCSKKESKSGITDGHEWVDLGLPSGTLWATCNVGADSPEQSGDYFAWGETKPKEVYRWETYKWMNEGQASGEQINKYTTPDSETNVCWYSNGKFIGDGINELQPADDAATANWGNNWQMPSFEQYDELFRGGYTKVEWKMMNGVEGLQFTSKSNGNYIFLPANGLRVGTEFEEVGSFCGYWSRSLGGGPSYTADGLFLLSSIQGPASYWRNAGLCVRPVRKK